MIWYDAVRLAFSALRGGIFRTLLTILGLGVGVGAVLAVLSGVMAVVFIGLSKVIPAVLGVILFGIAAAVIITGIRTSAECKTIKERLDAKKDSIQAKEKKKRE